MWILQYRADVESDFSVFHRLRVDLDNDDIAGLTPPRFFELAERLGFYDGVMTARIQQQHERDSPTVAGGRYTGPVDDPVESTPAVLNTHPAFEGLVETTQV